MFRKSLVFGVSFIALWLFGSQAFAQPDTVCGWIGPTNTPGDTGYIAVSDSHTQGEHSLNFVIHYVGPDTCAWDSVGYAFFGKYLGGIEFPDTMKIDVCWDTMETATQANLNLFITYKDTVWESGWPLGPSSQVQSWYTNRLDSPWFSFGYLVSPETLEVDHPPGHIDTLQFRLSDYGPLSYNPIRLAASVFIDNIRFCYNGYDTLIDGMGDEAGIEETILNKFELEVFPNPCLGSEVEIAYQIPTSSYIHFELFDIVGSKILDLSERRVAGRYRKILFLKGKENQLLPSGIYFLRARINSNSFTKKLILLH